MDETVGVSRDDFANLIREFMRRIRSEDGQEVLSQAILLDLTLEAKNAAEVLRISEAAVRKAGEGIRASYRAYQRGDPSEAADIAYSILSTVLGRETRLDDVLAAPTTTLSLVRAPDGNYWIRILDEQLRPTSARETAARTVGPLRRNQVCHQLILLGVSDRDADAFIERVDISGTAEIRGVGDGASG
jgi:hypothetical protein